MSILCTSWPTYHGSYIIYRNLARPPWGREGLLIPSIYVLCFNENLVFFCRLHSCGIIQTHADACSFVALGSVLADRYTQVYTDHHYSVRACRQVAGTRPVWPSRRCAPYSQRPTQSLLLRCVTLNESTRGTCIKIHAVQPDLPAPPRLCLAAGGRRWAPRWLH